MIFFYFKKIIFKINTSKYNLKYIKILFFNKKIKFIKNMVCLRADGDGAFSGFYFQLASAV